MAHYRFRRSFGNVGSRFRGARPDTYPLTDPDVLAFAAESGATDLKGLDNLVKYLKGEGLYSNFVIYPMKSAQNAGSGATVYSLGGLTDNDLTLSNGPSWGSSGIGLDGVNQYASDADFLGSETILTFNRTNLSAGTGDGSAIMSQYDTGLNNRSFLCQWRGDGSNKLSMNRSSDGTSTNLEQYVNTVTDPRGSDVTIVSKWTNGSGRFLWVDKASQALSLIGGTSQTSRFDSPTSIAVGAYFNSGVPTAFATMTVAASAVCNTDITTLQRETITDYINAL